MNYKTGLEDFIGKESLSKTLRNALIPTESTKIHMEEMGVIRDDELRAEKQQELKEIMDDYYRAFIEEKLGQIQGIQWNSLFQKMEETMEDISVRKDLDKIQNEKRKEIELLITGYNLGVDYIKMHPQKEWEQVLIEIGVPENLTGLVALPNYQKAKRPSAEAIDKAIHWLKENHRIPQTYSEKNLIDTTFIPTVSTIIKIK